MSDLPRRARGSAPTKRLPLFRKDLKALMYAFGDDPNTNPGSIIAMEDILTEYINEMCLQAAKVAGSRTKLRIDDFRIALRHDPVKLGRIEELLAMQKVIADARKTFDEKDS